MARVSALIVTVLALAGQTCLAQSRAHYASRLFLHGRDVDEQYDYIIVGGGTAGLTVADRLTEDGKNTVLVVEYGQLSNSASIRTVQGGFMGMSDASLLYNIESVPQTNLQNRTIAVLAGKVVGGSSAVNAMMTIRAAAADYSRWGSFFSDASHWSWDGLLPYFKRALNFAPPDAAVTKSANITYDASFWGNTSGVYAGWPSFQYPGTTAQVEAFKGIPGVPFVKDSGSGEPGVYWYPTFMDPSLVERSYARTGHHDKAANRTNYHLVTGSKVLRVLLEGTTATGVSFVPVGSSSNSTSETIVGARKEVIIAAGGIHSPQVLQLSGIGPSKILSAANITTVVDLPGVGQNFQDHPMIQATFTYSNFTIHPSPQDAFLDRNFSSWIDTVWKANRTGPNSIATGNAAAWLPFPIVSTRSENISAALAAQNHTLSLPPDTDPTVAAGYRAQMLSYASALRSNATAFYNLVLTGGNTNGILVALHPLSRGTVNVDPADPYGREPLVDYRALTNPLEAPIMADLVRFTRRYHLDNPRTRAWAAEELAPGEEVQTDEQFAEYLAETLSPSEFHPAGTCAMMPLELGGVVDEELKVYGVKGLRVVDASVFPTLPGGNTCQPVYAVAEKAADLIRFGPPKTEE
jgi:choline dehydrogenase